MSDLVRSPDSIITLACSVLLACSVHAATQDDELLVDPTVPLTPAVASDATSSSDDSGILGLFGVLTSYELSSVLIRENDRIAVINGQRVRVGESVSGARVTVIEPDHVNLNVNGTIQRVELYRNSIKTLSKVTSNDE
ncbi:MAG TPA: hypothetical protein VGE69_03640 [Pseudomonadales bacterium]